MLISKRPVLFIVMVILITTFSVGCTGTENNVQRNQVSNSVQTPGKVTITENEISKSSMYITFDEAIISSYGIVVAELLDSNKLETGTTLYNFKILHKLKGTFDEDVINVYDSIERNEKNFYADGNQYILLLDKTMNVFLPEPRYHNFATIDVLLDKDGKIINSYQYNKILSLENCLSVDDLSSYIKMITKDNPVDEYSGQLGAKYVETDDFEAIISQSEYIAKIVPKDVIISNEYASFMKCTVINKYKGDLPDEVGIHMFPNAKVGAEYLVLLVKTDENGESFTVSSKSSQIETDSKDYGKYIDLMK